MIAPLVRFSSNPIVQPADIKYADASGAFNPAAAIDCATGDVVLLVRAYERATGRSALVLARSRDGEQFDVVGDEPAIGRVADYEEWGVEDARITWLSGERRYAITYTGYSPQGPRVCLITTDDLLAPERYQRHGPRIAGDNKNCVILPECIDGQYVILHRPMPGIECVRVTSLEDEWPATGTTLVGPRVDTWRSSRVGSGAPPIRTPLGWLLPIHGATTIEEGNVYSMGWCLLDIERPETVRYVSGLPALTPEVPYEIELGLIPQVDSANFRTGVRVIFPQGLVERGGDLLVYYGAADVSVGGARVNKAALLQSLASAMRRGDGGDPL
ncbi:MAG: hypothetical protein ABI910_04560 [Gemmatimonadota bacterium]